MPGQYRGQIHRFFLEALPSIGDRCLLAEENATICKVLRLRENDAIVLIDGKGSSAQAKIVSISKKRAECVVTDKLTLPGPSFKIALLQGIPKMDRAEWIIQKSTELGVSEIHFVRTEHSVAHKKDVVLDRWNKIALEACRQSGQLFIPTIRLQPTLDEALETAPDQSLKILCNEYEKNTSLLRLMSSRVSPKPQHLTLAIGPEGGWSKNEVQKFHNKSFKSVYLNHNILRVETASIVSLAIATSFMLE